MINKNSDLKSEEILKLFIYSKIKTQNFNNYINKKEYEDFKLTEILIDEFNSNFIKNNFITNNWINSYPKVVNYFYNFIYFPKVLIWSDREKNDYYQEKLQMGFEFENYICQFFKENYSFNIETYKTKEGQYNLGESLQGIEIKNDALISKTGNIYIEFKEKKDKFQNKWVDSGILRNDNTLFYLIGAKEKFYIFLKSDLLTLFKTKDYFCEVTKDTSKGILLKVKNVESLCYSPMEMIKYIQSKK